MPLVPRDEIAQLAFDAEGCRRLQDMLDNASQQEAVELALKLKGHVRDAVESPHANHVVQKIIECLPTGACMFVAAELLGVGEAIARHRYGCRVLSRLVENHAHESEASVALFDEVLQCTHYVCRNDFGKHVLKSILEHSSDERKARVAQALLPNLVSHSTHRAASYVVQHALEHCEPTEQEALAAVLLHGPGVMRMLARSQSGCHVVRALVRHLSLYRRRTLELLREVAPEVSSSKYGTRLLAEMGIWPGP